MEIKYYFILTLSLNKIKINNLVIELNKNNNTFVKKATCSKTI